MNYKHALTKVKYWNDIHSFEYYCSCDYSVYVDDGESRDIVFIKHVLEIEGFIDVNAEPEWQQNE